MNNRIERVRYGRVNIASGSRKIPKNTLLTTRDGDFVHFGIARCNNELDRFRRDIGKLIASNRANLAAREVIERTEDFVLHGSGLRGTVKVENIKTLLQYFQNIDKIMLPERLQTEISVTV